jgi:uncharacterized protein YciI
MRIDLQFLFRLGSENVEGSRFAISNAEKGCDAVGKIWLLALIMLSAASAAEERRTTVKERYLVLIEFKPEKRAELKKAAAVATGKGAQAIVDLLPPDLARAGKAHGDYLKRLEGEGRYLAGGPAILVEGKEIDGINVFEVESEKELRQLIAEDPFQTEGVFGTVHIYKWNVVVGKALAHP